MSYLEFSIDPKIISVVTRKKEIYYSADEDTIKAYSRTFENTIDLRKLNEQRIKDCMLYDIESSICSDCPAAVMDASGGKCPESYCNGDFYIRKAMETRPGKTYDQVYDELCPYTPQKNCDYALKTNTFIDIFTSPLNFIGILPCQIPSYDNVPCSADDDGDSLFDEKLTEENKIYLYIQVYKSVDSVLESKFLLKINEENLNNKNYIEFEIPVKIREDDYTTSEGLLKFGISVDNVYFSSRVI